MFYWILIILLFIVFCFKKKDHKEFRINSMLIQSWSLPTCYIAQEVKDLFDLFLLLLDELFIIVEIVQFWMIDFDFGHWVCEFIQLPAIIFQTVLDFIKQMEQLLYFCGSSFNDLFDLLLTGGVNLLQSLFQPDIFQL